MKEYIAKKTMPQLPENFEALVSQIKTVGEALQQDARVVINRNITAKAWLTGYYIVEYEQHGNDRAKYGEHLLQNLSKRLGGKSNSVSSLRNYRQFYTYYPELQDVIGAYLLRHFGALDYLSERLMVFPAKIHQSLISESAAEEKQQSPIGEFKETAIAEISPDGFAMSLSDGSVKAVPQAMFDRLSFTHIVQLIHIEDSLQRAFYAIEAMRGPWSVRELQRQIDTNYYARSGWSKKPELLSQKVIRTAERPSFAQDVKSPYFFEFLGLSSKDAIDENDLETAIVSHLKDFMMELGMGFCLEEEQKRLLIDDRYYKADLVFYHRILKCHCIHIV